MSSIPNWLDLPSDVTANIIHRLGAITILRIAQKVCTTWYNICKDPAMWRVIHIQIEDLKYFMWHDKSKMYKHAVDRSQGQLLDFSVDDNFNLDYDMDIGLLHYIADRSSKLRRLQLAFFGLCRGDLGELLQKLPLLEELTLSFMDTSKEDIEDVGRYCPLLKTLKIDDEWLKYHDNEVAIAISKSLPNLHHLQLIGNRMSNIGLQAILDSCHHLESLDIRLCLSISLDNGDMVKRCCEQVKCVRLPNDSMEDHKFDVDLYSEYEYSLWSSDMWYSDFDDFGYNDDLHNNDDLANNDNLANNDDPSNNEEDFTKFEDINGGEKFNDCENVFIECENLKTEFEKLYEIKMKERKIGHVRKVLSKRKKKSIRNVPSKWKQKVMFEMSYRKERKTKQCSKCFDLEF